MQDQRASVASQSDSLSGSEEDREEIIFSVCVFCLVVFNLSLFHLTMLDYEIFFFFLFKFKDLNWLCCDSTFRQHYSIK